MTPEKKVQNAIINFLKTQEAAGRNLIYFRRQAGGFNYRAGLPDLYFVLDGRHFEVEVKAPDGELRPLQIKWKQIFESKNILWVCVDNLKEFEKFFEQKGSIGNQSLEEK